MVYVCASEEAANALGDRTTGLLVAAGVRLLRSNPSNVGSGGIGGSMSPGGMTAESYSALNGDTDAFVTARNQLEGNALQCCR